MKIKHTSILLGMVIFASFGTIHNVWAEDCGKCFLRKANNTDPETGTHLRTYGDCIRKKTCNESTVKALSACAAAVKDVAQLEAEGYQNLSRTDPSYIHYYKAGKRRHDLCSDEKVQPYYAGIARSFSRQ